MTAFRDEWTAMRRAWLEEIQRGPYAVVAIPNATRRHINRSVFWRAFRWLGGGA